MSAPEKQICPYCDTPFKGKPEDGLLCAKCMIRFEKKHL